MRKFILIIVIGLSTFPLFSFDFVDLDFSIAWQPITFFTKLEDGASSPDDFSERGQYFYYQSSLKFRSGLSLGFGLGLDSGYNKNNNIVGKFSDVLAHLGYNRFAIRVGHGNSDSIEKTTVDLLMDTYGIDYYTPAPWYMFAGINYTYLSSPLPLSPVGGDEYHINAISQLYGIILGSDLFNYFINTKKIGLEFYPWWDGWILLSLGTTEYQDQKEFVFDFRIAYTGGLLIGGGISKLNWCLGLGYNVDGGLSLLHHGFVVRFGIKI